METLETISHPNGYEQYWMTLKFPITLASGERLVGGMSFEVTERKQLELALRESEERWRLALEAAQMVAWDCNLETNEVQWSNNVDAIFDFPFGSFTTNLESAWAAMHPDDRPPTAKKWQQAIEQGLPYEAEFRLLKTNGEIHWIYDRGEVKHDAEGKPVRVVGVSFDITRRKQAEAEKLELLERERTAREQAEVANRIKDEFLAVLSHELRSPLNPILGWAQLLRKRNPSPSMLSRGLEVIERNAKLQTQLIQDLLDVSKILRGKMGLNVALVDLKTVVEAAIETVQLSAEAKFIQVSTCLASNVGQVSGDIARLQQVVWNLLSNAIKFTDPHGRIEIHLKQVANHAEIQVKDTGKGIAPDFLPYVFESFRQADSTITRQFGGLGLGLAIVRYLVELHGGTVWAESPGEGQGATFTVRLPLATVHQSSLVPRSTSTEECLNYRVLQGVQILVVDDDADTREFLTFVLEQAGATVTTVSSAIEALHFFMQSPPDILLSDIGMPEIDGYSLMRKLRSLSSAQGSQIPAIALTAYAGETDQLNAQAAGFQLHLAKPIEPQTLIQTIFNLLQSS
jgi:PAS domain S-box-containing protein